MAVVQEVLGYGQLAVEARRLKDDADAPPHRGRFTPNVEAEDTRRPTGRRKQRGQDAKESGLPPAIGAEQAKERAPLDRQVDARQGLPCAVGMRQADNLDRDITHYSAAS